MEFVFHRYVVVSVPPILRLYVFVCPGQVTAHTAHFASGFLALSEQEHIHYYFDCERQCQCFYKSTSIRVSVTHLDNFEQLPQSHVTSEWINNTPINTCHLLSQKKSAHIRAWKMALRLVVPCLRAQRRLVHVLLWMWCYLSFGALDCFNYLWKLIQWQFKYSDPVSLMHRSLATYVKRQNTSK